MEGEIFDQIIESLSLHAQEEELKNLEKWIYFKYLTTDTAFWNLTILTHTKLIQSLFCARVWI